MSWWIVSAQCVAKEKKKTWSTTYEFGCSKAEELKLAVARKAGREQLSREVWQLTAQGMKGDLIVMIAKARWIYHKGRCSMDNNQKKKMNIETVMQKLERRLTLLASAKASKK